MNEHRSINPAPWPEAPVLYQQVSAPVHAHQRKLRLLTCTVLILGLLAIAASLGIVSAYFVLYRPKEKEVLRQVTLAAEQANPKPTPRQGGASPGPRLTFDFPSVQATMTFLHSIVLTCLAAAVGLLAMGTLLLLAIVLLSRRATFNQINASLVQISDQLKALQPGASGK